VSDVLRTLLVCSIVAGCGPRVGTPCSGPGQCGDQLMCNGEFPVLPIQPCRSADDCPASAGGGREMICGDYVLDRRHYDHVCVALGQCASPDTMRPRH
jgi:hypothetical protein